MWLWICTEQKSSVIHVIVTWMTKYNWGYSCAARVWLSHDVCEHSSLPVRAHVNSLFLLWKGLCFTGNPNYCLFLFYSSAVIQSMLSHLPDLWIMHLREIPLSSEEQPKGSLETYPWTHSQLALENLAESLVIMSFFSKHFHYFLVHLSQKCSGCLKPSCQNLTIFRDEGSQLKIWVSADFIPTSLCRKHRKRNTKAGIFLIWKIAYILHPGLTTYSS